MGLGLTLLYFFVILVLFNYVVVLQEFSIIFDVKEYIFEGLRPQWPSPGHLVASLVDPGKHI